MKRVNSFTTIRGILYIVVIVSCFTFTPAKSESVSYSNSNDVIGSSLK